jgi:hypothetical protein
VIIISSSVVIDAGNVGALGPDMACPRMRVCLGVHCMEPMVGGDDFDSRVRHGCRLADHDVFLVADYKALRGDGGTASILWVMRPDLQPLAIASSSMAMMP